MILALILPVLGGIAAASGADLSSEIHQVLVMISESIGRNDKGIIRPRDADEMIENTFNVMDVNGDGRVTPDEFQAFSMGFEYLA